MATRINANAQKGRQAIEFIIHKMNNMTDEATKTVKSKFPETLWDSNPCVCESYSSSYSSY